MPRRRLTAAALSVGALLVGLAPAASAVDGVETACPGDYYASFYDVGYDNPHRETIACVAEYGIANGRDADHFDPLGVVSREQMASFTARAAREMRASFPAGGAGFRDVGGVHAPNVDALALAGIVSGYPDRTFRPTLAVTRDQMATYLARTYEFLTGERPVASRDWFPDDQGNTHEANINVIAELGITRGSGSGYDPRAVVRRDQMASFLARLVDRAVEKAPGGRLNPFPVGTSHRLQDDWRLQVLSVDPDATSRVLAENQFNDPPAAGRQFFIARVRATQERPAGSSRFDGFYRARALGGSGLTYSTFQDSCGVIPDPLPDPEAYQGAVIEGNVCWSVTHADAQRLSLFDGEHALPSRPYFQLTP